MDKNYEAEIINTLDYSIKEFNLFDIIGSEKNIIIYGAGIIGQKIYNYLKKIGITPIAFIDRNAHKMDAKFDIPVYTLEESNKINCDKAKTLVLIAIILFEDEFMQMKKNLESIGFKNIKEERTLLYPLAWQSVDKDIYIKNKEDILKVLDYMEDDISKQTFLSNLKIHILNEYSYEQIDRKMVQYYKANVPLSKGFSKVIDCGAYDGAELGLSEIVKHYKCDTYVGFEPAEETFNELCINVKKEMSRVKNILLFPCGVGDKFEKLRFSTGQMAGNKLDSNGEQIVQIVKIDDVLQNFEPTIIKMDIEGAEIAALNGARKMITEKKPDLAICVYHKNSDLWEIPLLIKSLVPEYKFYLRAHRSGAMETVLYATI